MNFRFVDSPGELWHLLLELAPQLDHRRDVVERRVTDDRVGRVRLRQHAFGHGQQSCQGSLERRGGNVFEDAAEIAESDRGVDALRHFRGLEAGRLTSARERVVHVEGGERGCQSAPTGVLQGSGVVNPAVAAVIEGHRGGDVLAAETSDQDVVGVRVGAAKEVRWHAGEA